MKLGLQMMTSAFSNSLFNKIPNEITTRIFRYLSVPDLRNVSLVCRSFKTIADQDEIWKHKSNSTLPSKSYKDMYMEWMQEKTQRNSKLLKERRGYITRLACRICPPPKFPVRPTGKHHFQSIGGFNQHPNSAQNLTIRLSVDIDKTTPELISLLRNIANFREQYQQSVVLKQMIQRYYRFMQLKASQPENTLLIPTIDIEIIWQTHLLRPEIYRKDCLRLFRRIIDHSLIMKNNIEEYFKQQAFFDTCQLYEQKFGEKYCSLPSIDKRDEDKSKHSYWNETCFQFSSDQPKDYENPFSFTEGDIILDLQWFDQCQEYMKNALTEILVNDQFMGLPIDLTKNGLKRLKKSYERFLYMAAKYPLIDGNGFIPPTYAIDIIWHSHMQELLNYEADCLRLVGYVIDHDPWPIVEDEEMQKSSNQIDQIWKDEFQCNIDSDHLYELSSK